MGSPGWSDGGGELPWSKGDTIAGWVVDWVLRHPEYVVLSMARGEERTQVEITFNEGKTGDWATRKYRVQPALGADPPRELLIAVIESLEAQAAGERGPPFVSRTRVK